MIASSILNSITFKNLSGSFPNMWNTLQADRRQGNSRTIAYLQKFQNDHVVYLQFESDIPDAITLKSYCGTALIESFTNAYATHYGSSDNRYYTNFTITLGSSYYGKQVTFKATQGANTLVSEPIITLDLTSLIAMGVMKYIKYTNLNRIEADLDDRMIDWSALPSSGNFLDMYVEAMDKDPNDTDKSEILEGSQSQILISSVFYSGRVLKSGGIPDYMATKLGMISSLDVFTVNDIQFIKSGEITQSVLGNSTLYQVELKLTQKNAIGINVDSLGISAGTSVPITGTPMYIGSVTAAAPTETQVKVISSITAVKANQTKMYSISNARFCFAYPSSFGSLVSILDNIGDEILSGFNVTTVNFTIGSNVISYTIYTMKSVVLAYSGNITFKFS